jgi:hypothetical protein
MSGRRLRCIFFQFSNLFIQLLYLLLQIDDSIVCFFDLLFIVGDRCFTTLSFKQYFDAFLQFTIDLDVALHSLLKL